MRTLVAAVFLASTLSSCTDDAAKPIKATNACYEGTPPVTDSSVPLSLEEMEAITAPHRERWVADYPEVIGIAFETDTASIVLDIANVKHSEASRICRDLRDSSELDGITVAFKYYGEGVVVSLD